MRIWNNLLIGLVLASGILKAQTLPNTPIYQYLVPNAGYAPNGNLLSYADSVNGQWSTVQYDGLNRLISATLNIANQPLQYFCWAYDSFGNRTNQASSDQPFQVASGASCQFAVSGTAITNVVTAPNSNGSNQIGSISGTGTPIVPTYDAAGNLTFDGSNHYLYDAEGRVCAAGSVAISGGVAITQYIYDAEGRRVAKGHPNTSTTTLYCPGGDFVSDETYIRGQNGEQVTELNGAGVWQHTNVYAGSQLLATYDQERDQQLLHFNITDPLGTKRVQASATGAVDLSCLSLPFGDGLTCSGSGQDVTEHHFTGKERDSESGLDYFGARYYGSSMGRFMSPDPSGLSFADPTNPQSLNLYSYVLNNPLKFTDPSGMECVWDDGSFDSNDDAQTGSSDGCKGQGGTWIDHNAFSTLGAGDWSNQANSSIAGIAQQLNGTSTTVSVNGNDTPWGYSDMMTLYRLWQNGSLPQKLNYGPWDQQTIAMSHDFAVNRARAAYIKAGCPGSAPFSAGHYEATADHLGGWAMGQPDYTAIEVGGYSGTITSSGDTATFTVNNTMSMSSLNAQSTFTGGHSTDNPNGPNGPQHNVQQTFQWTESGLCH